MNTNKTLLILLLVQLTFQVNAQYQTTGNEKGTAFYLNPVFAGDYPDPGILKDGDDYYLVHSSFEYYPGLLIWHSRDLINWSPVKNTLYKYVGSVWAPDLVKYKNKYYIYFPANNTNYVVYADFLLRFNPDFSKMTVFLKILSPIQRFNDLPGRLIKLFS